MNIKITAVVTTYNRKYEARRALCSIYSQTRIPDEVILVDDASEDGTREYLEQSDFDGLHYIQNQVRLGAGSARNVGIRAASGDYIAFLDSDNIWTEDKLEVFEKEIFESEYMPDFVFSKYKKHITYRVVEFPMIPEGIQWERFIQAYHVVDASAAMYRKCFISKFGGFSEKMQTNLDWELSLRVWRAMMPKWKMIDKCLSENYCMFDGMEVNVWRKYIDKITLYSENYVEMVKKRLDHEFYGGLIQDLKQDELKMDDLLEYMLSNGSMTKEFIYTMMHFSRYYEKQKQDKMERHSHFYRMLSDWMELILSGYSLADSLRKMGMESAAIYGAGKHGCFLYQDLKNSGFNILFFIDRNKMVQAPDGKKVYLPTEEIPQADIIIVSTYLEFDDIVQSLKGKSYAKIMSLKDLLEYAIEGKEGDSYVKTI